MTPEIEKALRSQAAYHLEDRSEQAVLESAISGTPVPVLEGLYLVAQA